MPRIRLAIRSGWNTSKSVKRLAIGGEHDRASRDARDREGSTAAGVTIQLGEYDPVETDSLAERVRSVDCVLADHGVDDEEDLVRMNGITDVNSLLHHFGVDAEPAGGVDDDHVIEATFSLGNRGAGNRNRVTAHLIDVAPRRGVARLGRIDVNAGSLADYLQLIDRIGSLQVRRDQ